MSALRGWRMRVGLGCCFAPFSLQFSAPLVYLPCDGSSTLGRPSVCSGEEGTSRCFLLITAKSGRPSLFAVMWDNDLEGRSAGLTHVNAWPPSSSCNSRIRHNTPPSQALHRFRCRQDRPRWMSASWRQHPKLCRRSQVGPVPCSCSLL